MHTPTCAQQHTVALAARLLGLRCHSLHAGDNTSSERQAFDSPCWKRSRHCWQCLCPLCICDPCKQEEGGQERDEMIKGQTAADSQKFTKQYIHLFSFPVFSPCRLQTASENGVFCINFVQTSKMTINKRRPELFALSDRNTQQRFERCGAGLGTKRLCPGERSWRGVWGRRGRLRREVPSHSELFRSIKPSVWATGNLH